MDLTQFCLPDLNIPPICDLEFDLNANTKSPPTQIFSTNRSLFDLNSEPCLEEDTYEDESPDFQANTNVEIDTGNITLANKKRNLSNDERRAIYDMLLEKSSDGKLKKGVTSIVAAQFCVNIRSVQRIWQQAKTNPMSGDVSHNRTGKCGHKRLQIDLSRLRDIPYSDRTTLQSLSCSMNTSKTTLYRLLRSGLIRRHTNAIKPLLKEENKRSRLKFCISMMEECSIPNDPIFKDMYNIIHIYEKWFYMTKKSEKYYLLPYEEEPLRTCKSKNFIGKVMFLVALARPRFDSQGTEIFSRKIGVFPFVTEEPAKRNSANRAAGTLEMKPIISVKRDVIRSYLIEKVLPAIKSKWPQEDLSFPIFIQQDNARTHINHNDKEFCRAAAEGGWDIHLMSQPPNSPDLNVLDLGFFYAIQSLQYKKSPKSVKELVDAVVQSFEEFSTVRSNHIFLTLQLCMVEIMKAKGGHKYKVPHINKAKLETARMLPVQVKCDVTLVDEVLNYLS